MQHHTKRRIGTAIFLMTIVCAISSESNSEEGSGETTPPTNITRGGNDITSGDSETATEHPSGTAPATKSTQGNAMLSVTGGFLLSRNTSITVTGFEEPLAKVLFLGVSMKQLRRSYDKVVREKYHAVMVKSKFLGVTEATYQINCEIKYSRRKQSVPSRMRRHLSEFNFDNMDRSINASIRKGLNDTTQNTSLAIEVIVSLINDQVECATWDTHCEHLGSFLNSTNASHILALINSGNSTSALISLSAALFNLTLSIASFEPSVTPLVEDGSSTSCSPHSGLTCDSTDSTSSSPSPSESPWSASSPLVIGLSCGGAAILIVCTIVIIVVKRRSIKQGKHKDHDLDEQFTMKDYRRHVVFKADASMDAYEAIEEIDKVVS